MIVVDGGWMWPWEPEFWRWWGIATRPSPAPAEQPEDFIPVEDIPSGLEDAVGEITQDTSEWIESTVASPQGTKVLLFLGLVLLIIMLVRWK